MSGWYMIGDLISMLTTTLNTVGDIQAKNAINEEIDKLKKLKADVDKKNRIDNQTLSKYNDILNDLMSQRSIIDPRLIKKFDQSIDNTRNKLAEVQSNIDARNSEYDIAATTPTHMYGMAGLGSKASNIQTESTVAPTNFENKI